MDTDSTAGFEFDVVATSDLGESALARVLALFRASYRAANEAYLQRSLTRLRFIATATAADALAGFALGEMRIMDLPRLPQQAVALAGICCVDASFRRQGLFRMLDDLVVVVHFQIRYCVILVSARNELGIGMGLHELIQDIDLLLGVLRIIEGQDRPVLRGVDHDGKPRTGLLGSEGNGPRTAEKQRDG